MASTSSSSSRPVEAIFKDYTARRTALIRALTIDVEKLYSLCAQEKEHLCLYGHPNESWEVTLPPEEVPSEIPEPVLGINFARDDLSRRDWLSLVAVHSDCWLLSVAFCLGGRLKRKERKQLFTLTNNLPTLYEIVTGQKPAKDKPTTDNGSKSQSGSKRSNEGHIKSNSKQLNESNGEDGEERGDTLCGSCGRNYNSDEFWICCGVCERWYHGECVKITRENFWICCDVCERWYHGECVKITPENAEIIMQYECSSCNNTKRARQKMPILD